MFQEFCFLVYTHKELKAETQREICTPMFIAALLSEAKWWKQSNFLLMDE